MGTGHRSHAGNAEPARSRASGADGGVDRAAGAVDAAHYRRLRRAGVALAAALVALAVYVVVGGSPRGSSWDRSCAVARADAADLRSGGERASSALRELQAVAPGALEPSLHVLTSGDAPKAEVGRSGVDVRSAVLAGAAQQRRLAASESVSSLLASHCAIKGVRG